MIHLFKLFVLALLVLAQSAAASLLINPTRVSVADGARGADITLINTSNATTTYRLEWSEKRALEGGGYQDLSAEQARGLPIASEMIRFSPRQVTLAPGERQTVKLAVRRPSGLAPGEYRSHLLFRALPPPPNPDAQAEAPSLAINIVLSFAIPVVVRQGPPQLQVAMRSAAIHYQPSTGEGGVQVDLTRAGLHSAVGDIEAYWTPDGGQEYLLAKLSEYSTWPELARMTANLVWVGAHFAPADGKLRVVYKGTKEYRGQVFFEETLHVNRSAITLKP